MCTRIHGRHPVWPGTRCIPSLGKLRNTAQCSLFGISRGLPSQLLTRLLVAGENRLPHPPRGKPAPPPSCGPTATGTADSATAACTSAPPSPSSPTPPPPGGGTARHSSSPSPSVARDAWPWRCRGWGSQRRLARTTSRRGGRGKGFSGASGPGGWGAARSTGCRPGRSSAAWSERSGIRSAGLGAACLVVVRGFSLSAGMLRSVGRGRRCVRTVDQGGAPLCGWSALRTTIDLFPWVMRFLCRWYVVCRVLGSPMGQQAQGCGGAAKHWYRRRLLFRCCNPRRGAVRCSKLVICL
mmetsp:Transcript_26359/g.68142  ORF Transcript_26359/g.68142 Transcript_26359/m.68142 type:complete len:296 (+) Transcript_26359:793-1680(+)